MTLKELREKRKAVEAKRIAAKAAIDALIAESDRAEGVMSAEQSVQLETLEADYEAAKNSVAALDRAIARESHPATATPVVPGRRAATEDTEFEAETITAGKPNFEDDPKKGFKSHREFFTSVMKHPAHAPASDARDERLRFLAAIGSDEQSTFSDSYGGFLVPEGMTQGGVLTTDPDSDPLAALTTKVPMSAVSVKFDYRVDKTHTTSVSGGLQWYRREEAGAATASRMQLAKFDLRAHSLMGLNYSTEELLTDSPQSIIALIEAGFRTELGSTLLSERLNGTGVGEFQGINNCAAKVDVSKETGQAAATIVYANVIKMYARCWGKNSAVWLANHDCLPQLMQLSQVVGVGGAIVWQPSAREGEPSLLLGRPIYFNEHLNTCGTVGDLLLVNPTQYLEGTYQPLQSAESIHVRFVNHERAFKFWLRNAGACWWDAPLTPKNGATLSPFVRLATRA